MHRMRYLGLGLHVVASLAAAPGAALAVTSEVVELGAASAQCHREARGRNDTGHPCYESTVSLAVSANPERCGATLLYSYVDLDGLVAVTFDPHSIAVKPGDDSTTAVELRCRVPENPSGLPALDCMRFIQISLQPRRIVETYARSSARVHVLPARKKAIAEVLTGLAGWCRRK